MKLLFDHNLSPRLVGRLKDLFPGSAHVRDFGLENSPDESIWAHAAEHGFSIISKDSDFQPRSFLRGAPPKVIWTNLGNCTTAEVEEVLRAQFSEIQRFGADPDEAFLVVTR